MKQDVHRNIDCLIDYNRSIRWIRQSNMTRHIRQSYKKIGQIEQVRQIEHKQTDQGQDRSESLDRLDTLDIQHTDESERKKERQIYRQVSQQTDRQPDKETGRSMYLVDPQAEGQTDENMCGRDQRRLGRMNKIDRYIEHTHTHSF